MGRPDGPPRTSAFDRGAWERSPDGCRNTGLASVYSATQRLRRPAAVGAWEWDGLPWIGILL